MSQKGLNSDSMAVFNGPYLMGYTDSGESLLTDPDQPSCSSYEPTPVPTNVSNEVAAPIKTEGPKTKKEEGDCRSHR